MHFFYQALHLVFSIYDQFLLSRQLFMIACKTTRFPKQDKGESSLILANISYEKVKKNFLQRKRLNKLFLMQSTSISNKLLIEGKKAFDEGNGFRKLLSQLPLAWNVQINGFWGQGEVANLLFTAKMLSNIAGSGLESCFLKKRRPVAYRKKAMICEA